MSQQSTRYKITTIDMSQVAREIEMYGFQQYGINYTAGLLRKIATQISKDATLIAGVRAILMSRLKYATGKLYRTTNIKAEIKYSPSKVKDKLGETYRTNTTAILEVYLVIAPELLNALLGEEEVATPVPDIKSVRRWIQGKRRFFGDRIDDIKKRESIRRALQRQRDIMAGDYSKVDRTIDPIKKGIDGRYKDPIGKLAEQIHYAMTRRLEQKGSATKGSEWIFLGYKKRKTMLFGQPYEYLETSYASTDTPLLTADGKSGEIMDYLNKNVTVYIRKLLGGYNAKLSDKESIESRFKKVYEDNKFLAGISKELDAGISNVIFICEQLRGLSGRNARTHYNLYMQQLGKAHTMMSQILLQEGNIKEKEIRAQALKFARDMQAAKMPSMRRRIT